MRWSSSLSYGPRRTIVNSLTANSLSTPPCLGCMISVNMHGYFLWFLAWNLGVIWINLRFRHVFLRLCSVLALLSCDCRLAWFGPSLLEKSMIWNQAQWRESQSKPNGPKAGSSKAHSVDQMKTKMRRSRSIRAGRDRAHHGLPIGPTTVSYTHLTLPTNREV